MSLPSCLQQLTLPVVAAPMFIISNPRLLLEQCKAGIVGSMPALNARPAAQLDEWLHEITETLAAWDRTHPQQPAAPFAVNLIVHKSNDRMDQDLQTIVKYRVPLLITTLGGRADVNEAIHGYGGIVLHDVINNTFARKAIEKGADGLIAVAAGAGGHGGTKSPFALIQEIRQWFDGPLVLGGSIATGGAVLAAQAAGADLAYVGSAFIATHEANAPDDYKRAVIDGNSDDIVYTNFFTGVHGNYLKSSVRAAGFDPDNLPPWSPDKMNFGSDRKAWKDIWSSGQGIGAVTELTSAAVLVDRLAREYRAAVRRVTACDPLPRGGLPLFDDAAAWYGRDMVRSKDWVVELSPDELLELDAASNSALARGCDLVTMTEADVPLPTLGPRLRVLRQEILHGRGFALLRGWPSAERTIEQNAYAFRAVGAHLGEALSQNAKGHVLGHVANLGLDYSDPTVRGYQTGAELKYHTDGGDIVGLLCIRPSKAGGKSKLCSSTTVWNEVARRRPDLARVLLAPFHFSRTGEVRPGQARYFASPIFQPWQCRMVAVLIQSFIQKAQSFEEVPRLTPQQSEALSLIQTLCDDPDIRLDMDFRPGDMQFLCNHFILHSRTAYEDWPEQDRRRHLLRLWLSHPDGPALPPNLTTEFQGCTGTGRPDGIRIPGVPLIAPLQPA